MIISDKQKRKLMAIAGQMEKEKVEAPEWQTVIKFIRDCEDSLAASDIIAVFDTFMVFRTTFQMPPDIALQFGRRIFKMISLVTKKEEEPTPEDWAKWYANRSSKDRYTAYQESKEE